MRLIAFLALVTLVGCDRWTNRVAAEAEECPELVQFDPAKAVADANRVPAGEEYQLGVYGFTREVPAWNGDDLPVRMIEGTSDYECEALNARTREYARRFNEAMDARRGG